MNVLEITKSAARMAVSKRMIRQAEKLAAEVGRMRTERRDSKYVEDVEQRGLNAIRLDALEGLKEEAARIAQRQADLESAYGKKYAETAAARNLDFQKAALRFEAMTTAELERAAIEACEPAGTDTMILDKLVATLRQRGSDTADTIRELLVKSDYARPWLHGEEGKRLKAEEKIIKSSSVQPGVVPMATDDGKFFAESVDSVYAACVEGGNE